MTDRELQELAAKAAGMKLWTHADGGLYLPDPMRRWNPLDDDGDALRLAVKLKLIVGTRESEAWAQRLSITIKQPIEGNPCAALRRAIVRAAARIWTKHSPLPMHVPELQAGTRDEGITWPKARDVGRIGDMSATAHIRVGLDSDNDVYVSVWDENGGGSIEFCNPGGGGGGQSSRTRVALIALMTAMEADNAEKPSRDWWAQRAAQAAAQGGAA